jgi:hypothetical protein
MLSCLEYIPNLHDQTPKATLNNIRGSRLAKVGCKKSAESSNNLNTEGITIGKINFTESQVYLPGWD